MSKNKRKSGRWKTVLLAVVAVLVILIAAGLASGYVLLQYYYKSSNHVNDTDVTIDTDYLDKAKEEGAIDEGDLATLDSDEANEVAAKMEAAKAAITGDASLTDGCYSLLLIGTDRRTKDWYGNSDAMILLTINKNTKTIYLTSFMRDLYANIANVGVRKLNAAHAIGGGPLLVSTIESNYAVAIDNYASVDFDSMSTIIDLVGGVDLDVNTEEAKWANNYVTEICELQGKDPSAYYIQGGGTIHMNGIQAVSYARVRYTGNSDYERTNRQRKVLMAIIGKAQQMGIGDLTNIVNNVVPMITHNLDQGTILSLISQIPDLLSYNLVSDRVPYDNLYYGSNEMLIPDFEQTITRLHATIYAKE